MPMKLRLHSRLMEAAAEGGDAGGDAGAGDAAVRTDIERRAKDMGWTPKDQWKGSQNGWLDAPAYVERGENILPLLQANNRKYDTELQSLRTQLAEAQKLTRAAQESNAILVQMNTKANRDTAKDKRRELLRAQVQARKDEDTEREIALGEQIETLTATISAAEADIDETIDTTPAGRKAAVKPNGGGGDSTLTDPMSDPVFKAWAADNPWFGTDDVMTAASTAIGRRLRTAGDTSTGRVFFDKVSDEVNKRFNPPAQRSSHSKVEGGANNGGGGGGGSQGNGKTFNDLPADAKTVYQRQLPQMVGEGRAFKTAKEWQAHYVAKYFEKD